MKRLSAAALFLFAGFAAQAQAPRNVILFVPDGLRSQMVTPETAPAMAKLARDGVYFADSHSLFPTFTTANASGLSTGHYLGDTGDFSNTIYAGFPVPGAHGSVTPFVESDTVLGDLDKHFGNYLDEATILERAFDKGYDAAVVGKLGPALIFSHTRRDGAGPVVVDDRTGRPDGVPLPAWLADQMAKSGIGATAPTRGDNGAQGTLSADTGQLAYFTRVATELLLPKFKQDGKPFLLVYWSRDPDGSQHNQGDSPDSLVPGISGPTSLAGIRDADDQLGKLRETLSRLGLAANTDIIVSADHGFSVIAKEGSASLSARQRYDDVPAGWLPPGFLALDLSAALGLPLHDPDDNDAKVPPGGHPKHGNGLLGRDPAKPDMVVAANGGSDLVYIPASPSARYLAGRAVKALLRQDYVSGIFVDPALGEFPGTLPITDINLAGKAVTPTPSIVVNFKSFSTGCAKPTTCAAEIADTGLNQGQGMHGSFSRGDTFNFSAAIGPDFKAGYRDPIPVSNADIGQTIAALLRLDLPSNGTLTGRPITEALVGGAEPKVERATLKSKPSAEGLVTILKMQQVGTTKYFDAAGFEGRTLGLD